MAGDEEPDRPAGSTTLIHRILCHTIQLKPAKAPLNTVHHVEHLTRGTSESNAMCALVGSLSCCLSRTSLVPHYPRDMYRVYKTAVPVSTGQHREPLMDPFVNNSSGAFELCFASRIRNRLRRCRDVSMAASRLDVFRPLQSASIHSLTMYRHKSHMTL